MSDGSTQPRLRLVGAGADSVVLASRRAIELENRRAAANPALDPRDPRWVVAIRTQTQLDGITLHPDRRERILQLARRLGVREFDANVIIATVQDRARRGLCLSDAGPVLAMLPATEPSNPVRAWPVWIAAGLTALLGAALLVRWVMGA